MMASEETSYLENLLATRQEKEKKYLAWKVLLEELGTAGRKKFGLTAKAAFPKLKTALEPFLGSRLRFSEHFSEW